MYAVYYADDTQGPAWSFAYLMNVRDYNAVRRIRSVYKKHGYKIMAKYV